MGLLVTVIPGVKTSTFSRYGVRIGMLFSRVWLRFESSWISDSRDVYVSLRDGLMGGLSGLNKETDCVTG